MKTNICIDDIKIRKDNQTTLFHRDDGFLTIGNSTIGGGIESVNSIVYHGLKTRNHPLPYDDEVDEGKIDEEKNEYLSAVIKFKGVVEPSAAILSPVKVTKFEEVTYDGVTSLTEAGYNGEKLFLSIIVFFNHYLDRKTLVKLFKSTVDAKSAALWDMGVINHFSFDPLDIEDSESILLACKGHVDHLDPENLCELVNKVQKCVREAVNLALTGCGFPKGVLGYMMDVGVEVDDLVEAGMELVVGVDDTQKIRDKLKRQILHSLEDLNVVSFIIAGIRLEEDYEKHRVFGVDVDDDPAYLYSDEVFGMSVANQIAGTKAIFNFKRYDEAKPGIISKLGPVLDDVFAGLVAGCMSKIFEV